MNGTLGLNILYDVYENPEAAARSLYPYLDRIPLSMLQVTTGARKEQGFAFAKSLKTRYPTTEIVLRLQPDEQPPTYQRYSTPMDWVNAYAPFSDGGRLAMSLANEAGTGDIAEQNEWYTAAVTGMGQRGVRVVGPNIQTGNAFPPAAFDSLYRALAKYDGWVSLHYYFDLEHGMPVNPIHETVLAYCAQQGIVGPKIAITELGYAENLASRAGYHGRLGSRPYGAQLADIHHRWPTIPMLVYGWGKQDPWGDFDVSEDKDVQDQMDAANQSTPVTPPVHVDPPTTGGLLRLVKSLPVGISWRNIRTEPDANAGDVGDLVVGDVITEYETRPDGWGYLTRAKDGVKGWALFTGIVTMPMSTFTFHAPFAQYKIVSHFNDPRPGYITDYPGKLAKHEGCDFEPADGVSCDAIVHVGAPCTLTQVGDQSPIGYGKFILVDFGNGFTAIYAHFKDIYVKAGQALVDGQIVGLMGQTGSASEPHVHISLSNPSIGLDGYVYPKVCNPEDFLA